ncbi:MAG: hypothetical protein AB4063_10900 [Crocosphaera sp.]
MPKAIAVKQQRQHHLGGIGRTTTTFVSAFYYTRIQLLNNVYNKTRKTVGLKPTFHLTGQLNSCIPINFDKFVANGSSLTTVSIIYI